MSEEDLKLKLEKLREKGIVNDNYDLKLSTLKDLMSDKNKVTDHILY